MTRSKKVRTIPRLCRMLWLRARPSCARELDAGLMRSALMADDAAAPTPLLRPRSSDHPHRRLGLDDLSGAPVLLGQPSVTEVQVELGRGDGAVPGLGPERLDGHAGLAQAREAGVAQLVTGSVREPRPTPGTADDLVEPL